MTLTEEGVNLMIKQKKLRIPAGDYSVNLKCLRIRVDGKAVLFYEVTDGEYDGVIMKTVLQRKPITSMKGNPR